MLVMAYDVVSDQADKMAKRRRTNKRILITFGSIIVLLFLVGRCGNDDKKSASGSPTSTTPTTTATSSTIASPSMTVASSSAAMASSSTPAPASSPTLVDAPSVIPFPISIAESKNNISIDATDIGQHLVDGVAHERAIFDKSNWRIVAQCDQMVGGVLVAGVIKSNEFTAISQAHQGSSIADNTFKALLKCP